MACCCPLQLLRFKKPESTAPEIPSPKFLKPQVSKVAEKSQFERSQGAQPEEQGPRSPAVLWEIAYKNLQKDDSKLTEAYEAVLVRIDAKNPERLLSCSSDGKPGPEMLADAVKGGLERTEKLAQAEDVLGSIVDVVLDIKEIVSNVLSAAPQAAAAWTGLMLVFEVKRFHSLSLI
jgi:hypothetical protein